MCAIGPNNVFLITNHVNKYIKENCEKYDIPYITHEIKNPQSQREKIIPRTKRNRLACLDKLISMALFCLFITYYFLNSHFL